MKRLNPLKRRRGRQFPGDSSATFGLPASRGESFIACDGGAAAWTGESSARRRQLNPCGGQTVTQRLRYLCHHHQTVGRVLLADAAHPLGLDLQQASVGLGDARPGQAVRVEQRRPGHRVALDQRVHDNLAIVSQGIDDIDLATLQDIR